MRILLYVLLFSAASFAASGYTNTWTPTTGDTVTAAKLKANFDSSRVWSSRIADTINLKLSTTAIGNASVTANVDSIAVTKRVKSAGIFTTGTSTISALTTSGTIIIGNITNYADSATARAAGVANGQLWKTSTTLKIMY